MLIPVTNPGDTLYNDLYKGGFARKGYPKLLDFRYKRGKGRLKLHEVCERVGKSVISFCKKLQNWITDAFHGYEKVDETKIELEFENVGF